MTGCRTDRLRRLALDGGLLWPLVRRQDTLPQPDVLRGDLNELVLVDELDRLLETLLAGRDDPDGLVFWRRPFDLIEGCG
jgi:hypothetical protein